MTKALRKDSAPSDFRLFYNAWVEKNAKGNVLDVGKSQYWDYGFDTIDTNAKLNPTILDDICHSKLKSGTYDVVLCNGLYECVEDPQKMVDECLRIARKTVIFGFVGEGYKPYKKSWKFYKKGDIEFGMGDRLESMGYKSFSNQYHFIICQKNSQK